MISLSELDPNSRIMRLTAWGGGFGWALAYFLLALVHALLSLVAGSCCISITVADSPFFRVGFMQELNHGPMYLIGFPIFLMASFLLLRKFGEVIRDLVQGNRLVCTSTADPVGIVHDANRSVFKRLTPAIFILAFVYIIGSETNDYMVTRSCVEMPSQEANAKLGWVQTNLLDGWAEVAKAGNCWSEIQPFKAFDVTKFSAVHPIAVTIDKRPAPWGGEAWFWIFLVTALAVEAVAIGVAVWVGLKLLWIAYVFLAIVPDTPRSLKVGGGKTVPLIGFGLEDLRLSPVYDDPTHRYGVGIVDSVFNRVFLIFVLGSGLITATR